MPRSPALGPNWRPPKSLADLPSLKCRHVPSGRVHASNWTPAQHHVLSDFQSYSLRTVLAVCEDLVARWNRSMPDMWHYWIEPAPQLAPA